MIPPILIGQIVNHLTSTNNSLKQLERVGRSILRGAYAPQALAVPLFEELLKLDGRITDYQFAKLGLLFSEIDGLIGEGTPNTCIVPYLLTAAYDILHAPRSFKEQEKHTQEYQRYAIGKMEKDYPYERNWGHYQW